jgi:hypothetical protein
MKVYCGKCKYFSNRILDTISIKDHRCKITAGYKDTPIAKTANYLSYTWSNKNNDCQYFKKSLLYKIIDFLYRMISDEKTN